MEPKETLRNCLEAMLEWEMNYYAVMRSAEYKEGQHNYRAECTNRARLALQPILQKYLTSKAFETIGQANLATLGVGRPPIYMQELDEDVLLKGKLAMVVSRRGKGGMMAPFHRYTLALESDGWKIKEVHHSQDQLTWRKAKSL